jgi:hypothetical protein
MNVAIVQGRVRGDVDRRSAHDGTLLISFDVVVTVSDGPSQQVPVTWIGPEGREPTVDAGMSVTVVGHVLRRFFRSGGKTMSRTDVRADRVIRGVGTRAATAIKAVLA